MNTVGDNVFQREEAREAEIKELKLIISGVAAIAVWLALFLVVSTIAWYEADKERVAMLKDTEGMREVLLAVQRLVLAAQRAPVQKMIELAAARV
ncbi:MAG: hypothetical protein Q7V62_14335 [Actinomycetota bacterium]|nr:hypothetical protein [Actinomycetota bacterium]